MDIEDILNGQAPEETPVAEEPAPEAPEPEAEAAEPSQPRDQQGRFAPKGETPAEPEAPAPAAPPAAKNEPPPGLLEERRKRQEIEAELHALRQQLQQQQPAQPQAPFIPSVYEDENGFAVGLTQLAVQQAQQALMPQFQAALAAERREFQEMMAAAKYPDFTEKAEAFTQMARDNPAIGQEALKHPNPIEWAYQYAAKAMEVQKIGSLDLEAIKQAAIAEYVAAQKAAAPVAPPQLPTSLADAPSARPSAVPQGPPSLADILGR